MVTTVGGKLRRTDRQTGGHKDRRTNLQYGLFGEHFIWRQLMMNSRCVRRILEIFIKPQAVHHYLQNNVIRTANSQKG